MLLHDVVLVLECAFTKIFVVAEIVVETFAKEVLRMKSAFERYLAPELDVPNNGDGASLRHLQEIHLHTSH